MEKSRASEEGGCTRSDQKAEGAREIIESERERAASAGGTRELEKGRENELEEEREGKYTEGQEDSGKVREGSGKGARERGMAREGASDVWRGALESQGRGVRY